MVFTENCWISAIHLDFICTEDLGKTLNLKKTSKYWNFKKTGTIYKQNFTDKTKFKKVFGAKQNKEMQDQNFDTCFFVFLDLYYKSFVSGR